MTTSTWITIAALFATSCLVRIIPAFVNVRLPAGLQRGMERVLPVAVFINFAVYIAYSEMSKEPLAASLSLLIVGAIALSNVLGLIGAAAIGTAAYFAAIHWLAVA
ncbi:hypothetical protein BK634_18570 [Pseudomonas chlororaphis]|jgi:hypothetical protein|uniref:Uncharacterized protein n=1 Tax=Pseudomonas morbosilactucae TaxID=2938197 RepID=A0A9X1YRY0_9PSED|nr:hypothetical protein [Pseudomonas morbosilactucae]MCK9796586.1 hypothetical protein [Pseudomonas morbosilactucae]MCK9813783.1 hypothetical protein [Pseudomonas morbosilactucae]ROL69738.1 hypothetical protein BK634_18570 [Pseudomonas chlororaphis]WEK07297.1 MAG: hypothetical protein P0Y51_18490 [Pseudomonas sp.]